MTKEVSVDKDNFIFHYDVDEHQIPADIDKASLDLLDDILSFVQSQFPKNSFNYDLFTTIEEDGSFVKRVKIVCKAVGYSVGTIASIIAITNVVQPSGKDSRELYLLLKDSISEILNTESEALYGVVSKDVIKAKNKYFQKCNEDEYIKGVCFDDSNSFILREDFSKHIVEISEDEDDFLVYGEVEVTAPVYEQQGKGRGRAWQGHFYGNNFYDKNEELALENKEHISFYMQDYKFTSIIKEKFHDKDFIASIQRLKVVMLVEKKQDEYVKYVKSVVGSDENLKEVFEQYKEDLKTKSYKVEKKIDNAPSLFDKLVSSS